MAMVSALLLLFGVLGCISMSGKSVTTDEVPHIAAGYSYWKTGEYHINPEHPPLAKLLAGFPLLFLDPVLDTRHPTWMAAKRKENMGIDFGFHFHFDPRAEGGNLEDHRTLLFWARVPIVMMGMVLCLYLYLLARLLYGNAAGLVTLTLAAFCPTILAHTRLVTTDVTLTAFWVASLYHMIRFFRQPGWLHLVACGLTTGLAMGAKFSGIFVLGLNGLVCTLSLFLPGGPWSAGRGKEAFEIGSRFLWYVTHMAVYVAVAGLVVAVLYAFHEFPRYIEGFDKVWTNHDPRYKAFFLGAPHAGIIPHYYLVAMLVKMPLGTLVLAGLGALWLKREGSRLHVAERLFLLLPALVVFVISTLSGKYLGVRYVLPSLPLVLVLAGRTAKISWVGRAWGKWVPAAGILAVVLSSLRTFPDYIPYFNEVVGGYRGGAALLDDSNIDWGQDWVEVAEFQKEHGIEELRYWPWNRIDPRRPYGIRGRDIQEEEFYLPQTGWYAVGVHPLNRDVLLNYDRPINFDWRTRYEPVAILGGATWIFRFWIEEPGRPAPPGFEGTVLTREKRFQNALESFERFHKAAPDSSGIDLQWAEIYYQMGNRAEARGKLMDCRRKAGLGVEKARARVSRFDIRRLHELPVLEILSFQKFRTEFNQVKLAADLAYGNFEPGIAVACAECAQWILDVLKRLPAPTRRYWLWREFLVDDYRAVQVRIFAHASRFALEGDPRDAEAVTQQVQILNHLARQGNLRSIPDARLVLEQEKARLAQWKAQKTPPGNQ